MRLTAGVRPFLFMSLLMLSGDTVTARDRDQDLEPRRPKTGESAPDFELERIDGETVRLAKLTKEGPVVVVVLRGFPGYQCPVCSGQVGQLLGAAKKLENAKAQVLLIYPGPADDLRAHAEEFIKGKTLPANFHLLIDPDYSFTEKYALRWEADGETAYPSTFVVDQKGVVRYAKISESHGGRANAADVLKALGSK